ncbi:hypothetical protein [Ponticaulis koreensis]|uniref:hypothetical protein n=1 Tax=Ponticaulis koreensis TaxID=1123045 RepID=UPI0012DFC090|nr:hypothetical protein [Ponticaulis koreensis]
MSSHGIKALIGWSMILAIFISFMYISSIGRERVNRLRASVDNLAAQRQLFSDRLSDARSDNASFGQLEPEDFETFKRARQSQVIQIIRQHAIELQSVSEIPVRSPILNAASWRIEFELTPMALSELLDEFSQIPDLVLDAYSIQRRSADTLSGDFRITTVMGVDIQPVRQVDNWEAFHSRNPFDELRRPMNSRAPEWVEADRSEFRLIGLRYDGAEWLALMSVNGNSEPEARKAGEELEGQTIASVTHNGVILISADGQETRYSLFSSD